MAQLTEPRWTHVALPVSDLDASIKFYQEVCGLALVRENKDDNGRGAWLSNPGQTDVPFVLVLAEFIPEVGKRFNVTPGERIPTLAPFAHIGIELPNREDIDAAAERAKAVGGLRLGPVDMAAHIGYVIFVDDPDGNTIEFSHKQQVFETIKMWDGKEPVQV